MRHYHVIGGPKGWAFRFTTYRSRDHALLDIQSEYERTAEWLIGEEHEQEATLTPAKYTEGLTEFEFTHPRLGTQEVYATECHKSECRE